MFSLNPAKEVLQHGQQLWSCFPVFCFSADMFTFAKANLMENFIFDEVYHESCICTVEHVG